MKPAMFDHPSYGAFPTQTANRERVGPQSLRQAPAFARSFETRVAATSGVSTGGGVGMAIGAVGFYALLGAALGGLVGRFVPFVGMTKGAIAGAALLGGWEGVSRWGSGAFGAYGVTEVQFAPGEVRGGVSRLVADPSGHVFAFDQRGQPITDASIIDTAVAQTKLMFKVGVGDKMTTPGGSVQTPAAPVTQGWGVGKGVILGVGAAAAVLIISRIVSGKWS